MSEALALLIAYLLGSIPTGHLLARAKGIDLRTTGSGNIGAANAMRVLGRKVGYTVMAVDVAKGTAAVLIAEALTDSPWPVIAGAVAVAGHVFPVWLGFKGGKGVATAGGVVIGLMPLAALILIAGWLVICLATRYTSVGSMIAAIAAAPVAWLLDEPWEEVILVGVVGVLIVVLHRGNIRRLIRGEELRSNMFRTRRSAEEGPLPDSG